MLKIFVMFKNIEKIVPALLLAWAWKDIFQMFYKQQSFIWTGAGVPFCCPANRCLLCGRARDRGAAKPEPLSPAVQQVNVKIIVKIKCWLTLKWRVKMDLAKSVESQNWKGKEKENKRATGKMKTGVQGSNQVRGNGVNTSWRWRLRSTAGFSMDW